MDLNKVTYLLLICHAEDHMICRRQQCTIILLPGRSFKAGGWQSVWLPLEITSVMHLYIQEITTILLSEQPPLITEGLHSSIKLTFLNF